MRRAIYEDDVVKLLDKGWKSGVYPAASNIHALPPAQPEQKWTPCSNTVDIPDYEVLCCDKRGNELIGWLFYSNGQWICESEGEIMYDTIAWMPRPKPYKERREG